MKVNSVKIRQYNQKILPIEHLSGEAHESALNTKI